MNTFRLSALLILFAQFATTSLRATPLYVSVINGNDGNDGSISKPLKSITAAAKQITKLTAESGDEIIILPGTYYITETAMFDKDKYTKDHRLTIRAETLPDQPGWSPQVMPIIVTAVPLKDDGYGGEQAMGLRIEASHVTIQGLHFTGSADYIYKDSSHTRRSYPIWRGGNNLIDLNVTQCMFTGNTEVMPLHVGIIANGNGLVVDHCVFYGCKVPVVFWRAAGGTSTGNAMRNCLVYNSSYAGVWTVETAPDFDFTNNIIYDCQTAWIRENKSSRMYTAKDCIISNNTNESGYGNPNATSVLVTPSTFLKLVNVRTSGEIKLEKNQSKRNYLQVAEGSFGSDLHAGLFKN